MDLPPAPPPANASPYDFKADKIIGVLVIILGVLQIVVGLLVIVLSQTVVSMMVQLQTPTQEGPKLDLSSPSSMGFWSTSYGMLGAVAMILAIFTIVSGTQVMKGTQRGLILALVVATVNLCGGPTGFVVAIGLGLYAVLRLWGNVGPRPA